MKRSKWLPVLALLLLPGGGCVDYEETFSITASGSGSIRSSIKMKADLVEGNGEGFRQDIERVLDGSGLVLSRYESRLEGKKRVTEFQIDFDHVRSLRNVGGGDGSGEIAKFFGAFAAETLSDRYVMTRTIDLSDGINGRNPLAQKGVVKAVAQSVLSNYTFTYHMEFPAKVLDANTDVIGTGTNRVTWRIPLTEALKGPVEMRAEIQRPPLLRWALLAAGALAGIVTVSWIGIAVTRKHRRTAPMK